MEEKKTGLIGEDVKALPLKDLLKRIGPGLIATGIVIGPGAVTTAAMLGANYGYALIWLMFPIIFMGITFVMTTNWLAITTGMPTIHAIRKYYGKGGATVVGIALFLACLFFTMGNISGTGAGMNLIFGINWKIGSAIMIAVVVYTYFARNVYSKVEKLITACIIVMILAFYITLFGVGHGGGDSSVVGFEGSKFFGGLFGFKIPEGSLGTALAFISTNAAITTGIYNTYLGKEKKWKKEDLPSWRRCLSPSWAALPSTSWASRSWAPASPPCLPIPSAAWCFWAPALRRNSVWRASSSATAAWPAWSLPWPSATASTAPPLS